MALMRARHIACALVAPVLPMTGGSTSSSGTRAVKPPVTSLSIAAAPVSAFRRDFNPFDTTQAANRDGLDQFIYEPLLEYDSAQDNQYYPWLASSWSFSTSGQNVTFDLRGGIHWSDGSLLSAADVVYTFDLVKQDPALGHGLPVVSAVANGPLTFTLTLSRPAYSYLYEIAEVPIVKVGYGAGRKDIRSYVDSSPDGTGPYQLGRGGFSARRVVLDARHAYWQGRPPIDQLEFPALGSRSAISTALREGHLDWAQLYMPNVRSFVDKGPSKHRFWFTPDSCTTLVLNFSESPFAQLAVRRAISNSLDRAAISSAAAGGYEPAATDAAGLVLPRDEQFLPPGTSLSEHSRPQAVARIMMAAGYRRSASGEWRDRAGRPVTLDIIAPTGAPLATIAATTASQLRSAGFAASSTVLPRSEWTTRLVEGDFQGAIVPGTDKPSPYFEYSAWLDQGRLTAGKASGGDFERASSTTAPSLVTAAGRYLTTYAASPPGSVTATAALRQLAALTATNLPVIPLVYDVAWGEFSTRNAQGWPDGADPYEQAVPEPPFAEYTVLQLTAGP